RSIPLRSRLTSSKYTSITDSAHFSREVQRRIRAIPRVHAAGIVAGGLPLERGGNNGVRIAGPDSSRYYSGDYREITPQFFSAMGIPVRQGRPFAETDTAVSNRVVIVNEAFAREHFPGRSALGEHLYVSKIPCEVI